MNNFLVSGKKITLVLLKKLNNQEEKILYLSKCIFTEDIKILSFMFNNLKFPSIIISQCKGIEFIQNYICSVDFSSKKINSITFKGDYKLSVSFYHNLKKFINLYDLAIVNNKYFTDPCLQNIGCKYRILDISNTSISDEGMIYIKDGVYLLSINLCNISDNGIRNFLIRKEKRISMKGNYSGIWMNCDNITDEGLDMICSNFPDMEDIFIGKNIDDYGLKLISLKLKKLKKIAIFDSNITYYGLKELEKIESLEEMVIEGCDNLTVNDFPKKNILITDLKRDRIISSGVGEKQDGKLFSCQKNISYNNVKMKKVNISKM